jgi:hypothetical protein
MSEVASPRQFFTSREFDRWWDAHGQSLAVQLTLDPATARSLAWEAWRKGREHLNETMASQRLQPARG